MPAIVEEFRDNLPHVVFCVTLWTAAHQASLSMGFPRQEYWRGLPFPSPGDLSDPGIKPMSPALAGRFFFVGGGWGNLLRFLLA